MRWLLWWAKNNPKKECRDQFVCHPLHPDPEGLVIDSPGAAYDYMAEMVVARIGDVREDFEIEDDEEILFVPVPSSSVTRINRFGARWSGREIGERLEQARVGTLGLLAVNKRILESKTAGARYTYEELRENYVVLQQPPPGMRVIYVDDILTRGKHVAALDSRLGSPPKAGLLCFGCTDTANHDAYDVQIRTVTRRYNTMIRKFEVRVEEGFAF